MASNGNDGEKIVEKYNKLIVDAAENDNRLQGLILEHILKEREAEFAVSEPFTVLVGTYNVNEQLPSAQLNSWIQQGDHPPDLIAVGFQELEPLSLASSLETQSSSREIGWSAKVFEALATWKESYHYYEVTRVKLVGIYLQIYARTKHKSFITRAQTAIVPTGIGIGIGRLGNKGGVGVSLKVYDTMLCFVNSHLAAHSAGYERRNEDFKDIYRMRFGNFVFPERIGQHHLGASIDDHDVTFWLGDLNYRLQCPSSGIFVTTGKVKEMLAVNDLKTLLAYDQLTRAKVTGDAFQDYREGMISFWPTYKYDPHTDNFDTSEKARTPAWCDRILWRADDDSMVQLKQLQNNDSGRHYTSSAGVRVSDHKPVSALFDVQMRMLNNSIYNKVLEEARKQADTLENEFLPQAKLEKNEFDFGKVKFMESSVQLMRLNNVGRRELRYRVEAPAGLPIPGWLSLDPQTMTVPPDHPCSIRLEINVDGEAAALIHTNSPGPGDKQLELILIIQLVGGSAHFVTIRAVFVDTCFGKSLDDLHSSPVSSNDVPVVADLIDLDQSSSSETTKSASFTTDDMLDSAQEVPVVIRALVHSIITNGINTREILVPVGTQVEFEQIRDCLDSQVSEQLQSIPGSVHARMETLCKLLDALPDPVIPSSVAMKALQCSNSKDFNEAYSLVCDLPAVHRSVFRYLVSFFQIVYQHSSKNQTSIDNISLTFGPLLLKMKSPAKPDSKRDAQLLQRYRQAASQFLKSFLLYSQSHIQ